MCVCVCVCVCGVRACVCSSELDSMPVNTDIMVNDDADLFFTPWVPQAHPRLKSVSEGLAHHVVTAG